MYKRCIPYWILVVLINLWAASATAQYGGYQAVKNVEAFKKTFSEEARKILSVKSDFVQEKTLEVLSEKLVSYGKFWFKRENKVRLEYEKPFYYLMIMNGDQMLVKDDAKENKVNVRSNKLFQQVNTLMVDCVQGTILSNKDFSVRIFENNTTYLLELTPQVKTLKEFFSTILISAEKKNYTVDAIEMREVSGDKTIIKFVQKSLNATVPDQVFAIR
jgi:outer membrane lipoprotein-sorting protein